MIKVENIQPWGFEHAIRGMRNPMNSWDKSDSYMGYDCEKCGRIEREGFCEPQKHDCQEYYGICIGPNDLDLMRRLFKAGSEHRKYLRQIFVSMDIIAPLYWWKEFDTYKVGVTADSCSTMHKIAAKEFTREDFSHEKLLDDWNNPKELCKYNSEYDNTALDVLDWMVEVLNHYRSLYLKAKDKRYWWQMIQLLPSSYNQRRTVTMNYENAVNIMKQRQGHKLDEWNDFCKVLMGLPYMKEITGNLKGDVDYE